MLERSTRIHLIGVGGIGMSALAQVYADAGYQVSGSDVADSAILRRLREHGVTCHVGHRKENIRDADLVVCSTAIRNDNPEKVAAMQSGKPIWKRARLLADVLSGRRSIVVTGCHGKTTTTSMITWMLVKMGLDPAALVGGEIGALGGNALSGKGEYIVAEGDESDKSILELQPDIAVITNVDFDHPDHYRDFEDVQETFRTFVGGLKSQSRVVLCYDDVPARELSRLVPDRSLGYGFSADAAIRAVDWRERPGTNEAMVLQDGQPLGKLELQIAGKFNLQNALAAVSVAKLLGLAFPQVAESLRSFSGARRRMEHKGSARGIEVYDDYAHHPTEIGAALEALNLKASGRKIVIFQPHRFTRTQRFAADFARQLEKAEILLLTGIYSAGDTPIEGVSGRSIFDLLPHSKNRYYCETMKECVELLYQKIQPGDTILTVGAGPIHRVGEELLERLG